MIISNVESSVDEAKRSTGDSRDGTSAYLTLRLALVMSTSR